jgi:hypothetical protein
MVAIEKYFAIRNGLAFKKEGVNLHQNVFVGLAQASFRN